MEFDLATALMPFRFGFMQNAFAISIIVSVPTALLSCFLVLKGWALMGDAISHAILPGIVLAHLIGAPLILGAFAAGMFTAVATAAASAAWAQASAVDHGAMDHADHGDHGGHGMDIADAGVFGTGDVDRLFTNTLDWDAHPYFQAIRGLQVSAHFVIRRTGEVLQFVATDRRAWHAGPSCWRGRENCNQNVNYQPVALKRRH